MWGQGSAETYEKNALSTLRKDLDILDLSAQDDIGSGGQIFTFSSPAASAIDH